MSKTIIITGASSGIGKASALKLLKEGHKVYAGARRIELMQDIKDSGGVVIGLDVTDQKSIDSFVAQVLKEQGKIDILFNNAGYGLYGAVEDIEIQAARRQFEVNIFGLAAMTKAVLPTMRAQKFGKIINTSSMGGKIYTPLGAWYHATKYALEGWSDCLRLELKMHGIDVVLIEPGVIATEFAEVLIDNLEQSSKNATGAYQEIVDGMNARTKKSYETGNTGSDPSLIANLVLKAVNAKNPKTRYVAGQYARLLMFVRKWFGDRIYDRIIMSIIS